MIMGRKSYDNPHRIWSDVGNYVITRQQNYVVDPGFDVAGSFEEAIKKCHDQQEVFVLGGEEIFRLALPLADKIYLTIVHANFEGDAFFPEFYESDFTITDRKEFKAGENTPYAISILTYDRKSNS